MCVCVYIYIYIYKSQMIYSVCLCIDRWIDSRLYIPIVCIYDILRHKARFPVKKIKFIE